MTDDDALTLHQGLYNALAILAARGDWTTVRALLAHADPEHARIYRDWLRESGHIDPEETLKP